VKYFEWLGQPCTGNVRFRSRHINDFWMMEGSPVTSIDEPITAAWASAEYPAFDFGTASNAWPICSQGMRDVLETLEPGSVQYLPFYWYSKLDGSPAGYVMQLLRRIDSLDRQRTVVRRNWIPINEFGDFGVRHPIVLAVAAIGDERLFRIHGKCLSIVVREDLMVAIRRAGYHSQRFDLLESVE
jgi:hypothetical protein